MTSRPLPDRITVAIATYRRESVLLDTLDHLLTLSPPPDELLVLDQTEAHESATTARLRTLAEVGAIRWIQLSAPSIPKAMNQGLLLARNDIVLFLDDDIVPEYDLLAAHLAAHARGDSLIVAGRVIQPWQEGASFATEEPFHFASMRQRWINEFMGGNFSVRRDEALKLGGFDENFVRVAYRFEAEFAHRHCGQGGHIFFEPRACLHHLKAHTGGTRTYGEHLSTWRPDHAVGAYYHALRARAWRELVGRPLRAITTRYHSRHPWQVPGTLLAELSGMAWAVGLFLRGPRHVRTNTEDRA